MSADKPYLLVAIPVHGDIKVPCFMSIVALIGMMERDGWKYEIQTIDRSDISLSRNIYGSLMVQDDRFTHLLFIDSDMKFRPDAITRLFNADKPIVGFICPFRHIDLDILVDAAKTFSTKRSIANASRFSFTSNVRIPSGSDLSKPLSVAAIGMAVTLVKAHVFRSIVASASVRTQAVHKQHDLLRGPLYGLFDHIDVGGDRLGEDVSFCERYRTICGGEIFAFIDEYIRHVGAFTYESRPSDLALS